MSLQCICTCLHLNPQWDQHADLICLPVCAQATEPQVLIAFGHNELEVLCEGLTAIRDLPPLPLPWVQAFCDRKDLVSEWVGGQCGSARTCAVAGSCAGLVDDVLQRADK
jgi:hypothetical protein